MKSVFSAGRAGQGGELQVLWSIIQRMDYLFDHGSHHTVIILRLLVQLLSPRDGTFSSQDFLLASKVGQGREVAYLIVLMELMYSSKRLSGASPTDCMTALQARKQASMSKDSKHTHVKGVTIL